ncbi:MAG: DUF4003 domain-containing protein [Defluviitaleaceae bacterium]|nr:DUF4003 domain-containing protein [Defluviitaleaceae bacterium]
MNQHVEAKIKLFSENYQNIRGEFIWQEPMAKRMAAFAYALADKPLESGPIRHCHGLIKKEAGVFSSFRGLLSVYLAAALSLNPNPEQVLADTLYVHDLLKDQGFWRNDYLVISAYEIAVNAQRIDFERMAARTRNFYDEMKANHRFLVGQDDYIFAAMLALSGIDEHTGANKLKGIFIKLKEGFGRFTSKNSLLTLSQMMVLGSSTDECVDNITRLSRALRKRKIRLDRTYTLPSLGALGLLNLDYNMLADELIQARDFLRSQKGFGAFSVSIHEILLYVVSLVTHAHIGDSFSAVTKAGVTTSVTNLIIAQQVAMIVAITAASTAAAASC